MLAFLGGKGPPTPEPPWNGILITDQYAGYNAVLDTKIYPQRRSAVCAARARRYLEELSHGGQAASQVATEALQRWARVYHADGSLAELDDAQRCQARQQMTKPLWEESAMWLKLQRGRVLDGSKIAEPRRSTTA